jgi:hypothetical protein
VTATPRISRDGPRAAEPESRQSQSPAAAKLAGSPPATIRRGSRNRQQVPIAPASVFGPVGRRRSWWYTYRCRICGAYLFGRAKTLDAVAGERRAGCGHRVQVMAARIYSQPESGTAA